MTWWAQLPWIVRFAIESTCWMEVILVPLWLLIRAYEDAQ